MMGRVLSLAGWSPRTKIPAFGFGTSRVIDFTSSTQISSSLPRSTCKLVYSLRPSFPKPSQHINPVIPLRILELAQLGSASSPYHFDQFYIIPKIDLESVSGWEIILVLKTRNAKLMVFVSTFEVAVGAPHISMSLKQGLVYASQKVCQHEIDRHHASPERSGATKHSFCWWKETRRVRGSQLPSPHP